MKELICIVCPKGCHLQVDEAHDYAVTGNSCPRGAENGIGDAREPDEFVCHLPLFFLPLPVDRTNFVLYNEIIIWAKRHNVKSEFS